VIDVAGMPTTGTSGPQTAKRTGLTISPKVTGIAVILVAAVWFILVNRWTAHVRLWVPKVSAPMWLVLMITFLGGLVTGLLVRRGKTKTYRARREDGPGT
jgi:uncharacterized integral membrane protein